MKKTTISFLLVLFFFSCNKKSNIIENDFRNKTFKIVSEEEDDTITIEFKDSVFNIFELRYTNIPWKLSQYENSFFLVSDLNIFGINRNKQGDYNCKIIGKNDYTFTMLEHNPKWKIEQIYGTWIEEKFLGTDSTDFPPPPINDVKSNWPPRYVINENKILYDFYNKTDSEIKINNSAEFISMKLHNPINYSSYDQMWQIKHLSDSIMIIDKSTDEVLSTHSEEKIRGVKLIKKR